MKELSLNVLDITENSLKAGSTLTEILLCETNDTLSISIRDNGCGMKKEMCERVTDPFCTSRTTRKVGLGVPFFKMAAEMTGGSFKIESRHIDEFPNNHGTEVEALFYKNHIDFTPLGDVTASIITLIQGNPDRDFFFRHTFGASAVELDTKMLRKELGDIPLSKSEVIKWIEKFVREQYENL